MSPVFVILPTDGIGGAEKRFAGICALARGRGEDVRAVVSPTLRRQLLEIDELREWAAEPESVVESDGSSRRDMLRTLARLRVREPRAVYHDVLVSPLVAHVVPPRRTLFTIPNSSLDQYNWKGRALVYAGVLAAARVDVLDPDVYDHLRRNVAWRRERITLTPGSYVDLQHYVPAQSKRDLLAFCGLFSSEKQVHRLVDAIPTIDRTLRAAGIRHPAFRLMGRESEAPSVADACATLRPAIDIEAGYDPNPARTLADAKVFFSLQRTTNHPSKALLEAMACGCLPVVTDVGSTRSSARPGFSFYVSRDFRADEIADACVRAMTLSEDARAHAVASMRKMLANEFSVEGMAAYYRLLWDQVSLEGSE